MAAVEWSQLLTWQTELGGGQWGLPTVERQGLWLFRFPGCYAEARVRPGVGSRLYSERLLGRGVTKMAPVG